jgi:hypothetical protein
VSMIRSQTSRRNHTVNMRMSEQILTPGMEYRKETDLCPQMFGVGGNLEKRFRTGAEQEVIEDLLVLQRQLGKLVR